MKTGKLFIWLIILTFIIIALTATAVSAPRGPEGNGIESIHDSYVYFNPLPAGDSCSVRGSLQNFCFQAISYTTDWDFVSNLYMRLPADWDVEGFYVQGTPTCINGGTFGPASLWEAADNEVRINHVRYQANPSDTCQATYCLEVTSGSNTPGSIFAWASWYWVSSGYGSPPYHPCSSDGYTPTGQPACDEAIWSVAVIPSCPSIYLPFVNRGN
jgi:hypothetical protein